jgi:hypothetical protein
LPPRALGHIFKHMSLEDRVKMIEIRLEALDDRIKDGEFTCFADHKEYDYMKFFCYLGFFLAPWAVWLSN